MKREKWRREGEGRKDRGREESRGRMGGKERQVRKEVEKEWRGRERDILDTLTIHTLML